MNRRPRYTPPRSRDRDYDRSYGDDSRASAAGGLLAKLHRHKNRIVSLTLTTIQFSAQNIEQK